MATWQQILIWAALFAAGWLGCLAFVKASQQARADAARLLVALPILGTYLTGFILYWVGVSKTEPATMLGVIVAGVVAFIFPKQFMKFSKDGQFEVGSDPRSRLPTPEPGSLSFQPDSSSSTSPSPRSDERDNQ